MKFMSATFPIVILRITNDIDNVIRGNEEKVQIYIDHLISVGKFVLQNEVVDTSNTIFSSIDTSYTNRQF